MFNINFKIVIVIVLTASCIGLINNAISPTGVSFIREKKSLAQADESDFLISDEKDYQVKAVPIDKVIEFFESEKALFVDARDQWEFSDGHIKNAVNLPSYMFEEEFPKFEQTPKDELLIIYCDDPDCGMSKKLALDLVKKGYKRVFIFEEGWRAWQELNMPTGTGAHNE